MFDYNFMIQSHHRENRRRVAVPFGTICLFLSGCKMEEHGNNRSAHSSHKEIAPRSPDLTGPGEELRLDHRAGNSGSGEYELRSTLNAALQGERSSAKSHEVIIGFSGAMFEHASEYREVYHALLHTQAWPLFRQRLQEILDEIIRRECKAEIAKLKKADSEVPVDLFVHYLTAAFLSVLTWWLDRRGRLTPSQINKVFRSLVLPTVYAALK